jgi:hypothetical protein
VLFDGTVEGLCSFQWSRVTVLLVVTVEELR